jgi:hypothetical protein
MLKRGIWISLFVLFIYFLSYAGIQHSIDELATISLSESILHGSLEVNRMEWEQTRQPPQNAYGIDDNLYSKKGLGPVLAVLPLLWIGKGWDAVGSAQLSYLTSAIVTAVTVFVFYLLCCLLDYNRNVSTIAAIVLGLGTLLWPYSQMLFSEPIAALGVAVALLGIVKFWKVSNARWLFLCGLGCVFVILSRTANAVILLPFFALIGYRLISEWKQHKDWSLLLRNGLAFGLPIGVTVLGLFLYNYFRFETLLSYPRVPGEAFTTPLWIGVSGQLWSSGKGLIFYVPLTLMIVFSYFVALRKMISPVYLAAFFIIFIAVLFYGKWYDWPGGQAWGPRFLVPTMPALVMLCLPTIDWLTEPHHRWRRVPLVFWLLLTIVFQIPGVLVNFNYQEILDGKAGMTYHDLLWNWSFSPLLTYWNKIFTGAANPVWLHPFFWENSFWLLAFIGLLILIVVALHIWLNVSNSNHSKAGPSYASLGVLGILTILFGFSLVIASKEDPRWQESTGNIVTNRAIRTIIGSSSSASDLVLLDMQEGYDSSSRVQEWLNETSLHPDYIGFKRKSELTNGDDQRLRGWLDPYPRVWLVLQATPYGAPESTTENWLRSWAYEGQNQWVESSRITEYLIPGDRETVLREGTAVFQTDPPLIIAYTLSTGKTPSHILLDLDWENEAPWLNYSLQLMNGAQTELLRQIDKPIAGDEDERLGMVLSDLDTVLLLRVYDPNSHMVYPVEMQDGSLVDHLLLVEAND